MVKFNYLEKMVTNQKCIHKEITKRLNSGNACYHAIQTVFPPAIQKLD
jgi:hypothetical protein